MNQVSRSIDIGQNKKTRFDKPGFGEIWISETLFWEISILQNLDS